jgi:hypothetical protein
MWFVKSAEPVLQFQDIVVSVARKTDAQMWPALFAAVGPPSALLDELLDAGQLTSAACCLLIVDRIEGAQEAHRIAIILIKVSSVAISPPAALLCLRCCSSCYLCGDVGMSVSRIGVTPLVTRNTLISSNPYWCCCCCYRWSGCCRPRLCSCLCCCRRWCCCCYVHYCRYWRSLH